MKVLDRAPVKVALRFYRQAECLAGEHRRTALCSGDGALPLGVAGEAHGRGVLAHQDFRALLLAVVQIFRSSFPSSHNLGNISLVLYKQDFITGIYINGRRKHQTDIIT